MFFLFLEKRSEIDKNDTKNRVQKTDQLQTEINH